MATISLSEWAEKYGIPHDTARYWARNGTIKATKISGYMWVIDPNTKPPKTYQPKGVSKQEELTI